MSKDNLENYKPIPNYSRYLINESGDVWDTETQRILVPNINGGYKCLNLYRDDGKKVLEKVHRCVAYAYLTKPDNAENIVIHKTEDRFNNHVSNLEWKIKGVHHPMIKRYSHYCGVRYHIIELEKIASEAGISLSAVRQRLEIGWTASEILQGYKHSSVFWIDDMKFIGELEVKKYLEMLDRDSRRKERESLKCEIRHRSFLEELERSKREKERLEMIEKRGTEDSELVQRARGTWSGMMDRCYNPDRLPETYNRYGGSGVTVCEEWHDVNVFIGWYVQNHIEGWDIEKDVIPLYEGRSSKQYSPENCCFVPKAVNQWIARTCSTPKVLRNSCGYYVVIRNKVDELVKPSIRLRADNIEDLIEQWYLYKDLHFEKRMWEMKEAHKRLCTEYPTTPQISPKILSILENFSTEEYLRKRNISVGEVV